MPNYRNTALHKGEISKTFLRIWCQEIVSTILWRAGTQCFSWFQNKNSALCSMPSKFEVTVPSPLGESEHWLPAVTKKNNVTIETGMSRRNIPDPYGPFISVRRTCVFALNNLFDETTQRSVSSFDLLIFCLKQTEYELPIRQQRQKYPNWDWERGSKLEKCWSKSAVSFFL